MAGSWVFAVGNDWDRATPRTPVAGQVVVHQWVNTSSGDTYWVQSTDAPSTAFALVDIHDTAPTADQWNYAAVEIVATRQSGLLSAPVGAPPRAVSLSGAFPNPSTGGVELWLTLPREDDVALSILDVQGREVWRAPAVRRGQGRQALAWDGRSASGPVRSGVYLGCVRVGQRSFTRRFAIVR
jgi:hypothetical protein